MADSPQPLGEHYFYFVTTPCPTTVEPCTGEYTQDIASPPTDPAESAVTPRQTVGALRCSPEWSFSLDNVQDKIGLFNPIDPTPLVTYAPADDQHIAIRCAKPFACKAARFATRAEALASLQQLACPQTTDTPDGEIMQLQLRIPFTHFGVVAADRRYAVFLRGLGAGGVWHAPQSWVIPLRAGALFEWLTGSPESTTGTEAEIHLDRIALLAEIGVAISSNWIRKLSSDEPVPWPVNVEIGASYRIAYEHLKGEYRFADSTFPVDAGGFNHYPALWLTVSVPLGNPTVPSISAGFDESFAGLFRGTLGGIADNVHHHTATVSVGLGTYATAIATPSRTLTLPERHYPLADHRPSASRRRPQEGVAVELIPASLEDSWGYVYSTTLAYDADGTLNGHLDHDLSALLSAVREAADRRPHANHLNIRYVAYTNSVDTDAYNATLSQQWADASKTAIDALLRADVNFRFLMQNPSVTSESVGLGESKPVDTARRVIDASLCTAEAVSEDRTSVVHTCNSQKITEDLQGSRRLEVIVQAEKDDIASVLHRRGAQRSALEDHARMLPGGIRAFPLNLSEQDSATAENFDLVANLPRRRFVSVLVSGHNAMATDTLVEQLLPAIRSARHRDLEIVTTKAPLGGTARAFVLVHPEQRLNLRDSSDPVVRSIMDELAK